MSSGNRQEFDDQVMVRYLFGSVPEDEAERLDELSIADDAFAGRLSAAENDLVDAYVRGELSGDTLERFQSFYLASPKRREKVRFAEALFAFQKKAATAPARNAGALRPSFGESFLSRLLRPSPRLIWQGALASIALLIVAGAGILLRENLRLRNHLAQLRAHDAAAQQSEQRVQEQLNDQRSSNAEARRELGRVRDSRAQLPALGSILFVLSPQTRGASLIPAISVPATIEEVEFQLELESDDFPVYQLVLRDPTNNRILWRDDKLSATSRGERRVVSVRLSTRMLKDQNNVLELSGIPANGSSEFVGSYPFRVVKP